MVPTNDYSVRDPSPSSSPIKLFLDKYEELITKYEQLIRENIAINTELKVKLDQLPTKEGLETIIRDNKNTTDNLIKESKAAYETLIKENTKVTTDLIKENKTTTDTIITKQTEIVSTLKSRLNWVLTVLGLGYVICAAAFILFNSTIDKITKSKAEQHSSNQSSRQPHIDYIDQNGNQVSVPVGTPEKILR